MRLQAAINGARERGSHPQLPTTVHAMGVAAAAVVNAGAESIHMHVRNVEELESIESAAVAACLSEVRRNVPNIPAGVSTGAWIVPDPAERLRLVEAWSVLPDFASVNFHEAGAVELAQLLRERGIGIEAGLSNLKAARVFIESGLASVSLRLLIEPFEPTVDQALRNVDLIEEHLQAAKITTPRLLHGTDATCWPILTEAYRRGHSTRIGFEDTFFDPDGHRASDNAALVRIAREKLPS